MNQTTLAQKAVLFLIIFLCPFVHGESNPERQPIAFVNVNVVPMDCEVVLPDQTVMVRDGKIISVAPASKTNVPALATRIDGTDKYLMPGPGRYACACLVRR